MSDFIPKGYTKQQITIRIDEQKLEKIDRIAAKFNLSRSAFVNQCIDYALSMMEIGKES
ncbi:MAG: CopG family transcriptional regulator [Peptococcaceae bacterium]|jgi:predicted transcriptional regulator|nr:CopG family transcriptional regulator [Peptococcaceae bacterium]